MTPAFFVSVKYPAPTFVGQGKYIIFFKEIGYDIAHVNKNSVQAAVHGSAVDIAAETCKLIHAIYNDLDDESGMNVSREFFRKSLVAFLTNADSPLFIPIEEFADASEDGDEE